MKKNILISPSLLSADFLHLDSAIEMINRSEAEWLHMDVMDGVFVPNISFGFPVIKAVHTACQKVLDVHMMTVKPDQYIQQVAEAGGTIMTVHTEACTHLHRVVQQIHQAGMRAGVALNPATPISMVEEVIEDIDMVLIMSVNPGFSGQSFIPTATAKVARLRKMIDSTTHKPLIEVDGGINAETAPMLVQAGADVLVSGNYIFKSGNPELIIKGLKELG